MDPSFVEALLRWPWSTNVRELHALLWSSVQTSRKHYLEVPPEMARAPEHVRAASEDRLVGVPSAAAIREALQANDGNQAKAAAALGLPSRFALYRLMRRLGVDPRAARSR
jgi:transcriptional regulator of acetoin/glycerol metabolism